jgi:hypothetical protein
MMFFRKHGTSIGIKLNLSTVAHRIFGVTVLAYLLLMGGIGSSIAFAPTPVPPDSITASAGLECTRIHLSSTHIQLPAMDVTATLSLRNPSDSTIIIVKPRLSFWLETAAKQGGHSPRTVRRDITSSVYVEPAESNSWSIATGQSSQLKFKIQFLHDTPPGRLRVLPRIEYVSQRDNAFPSLMEYGGSARNWHVDNPVAKFNAKAERVGNGEIAPGLESVVRLSVEDNRLKGRITLRSPRARLKPATTYLGGILFKSDRSGWDSLLNKGAAITEYDESGAIRATPLHLYEVPYWSWELTRFKSQGRSRQVQFDIWNRGWALGQKGRSWYGAAFLVEADKVQVLRDVHKENPVATISATVTTSSSPIISFLGDYRPEAGEGGRWVGYYGNKSFILCGMQSPQDIVGGRFLPRRRLGKNDELLASSAPVWTDWAGEFSYSVKTGDPNEEARHWIPFNELTTQHARALINPLEGEHRYSSWDDRGEARPFDNKGPDLVVNMEIPKGLHRLTFYFMDWDFYKSSHPRAHRLFFTDGSKDEEAEILNSGYVGDFGQGLYKVYGVAGPCKIRLRIQKDKSVCAVLSGLFLDDISLMSAGPLIEKANPISPLAKQVLQSYESFRNLQSTPAQFFNGVETSKSLFRLANQMAQSSLKDQAAIGEWLRWQMATSLVVAPWVKIQAFRRYLLLHPFPDSASAQVAVKSFLAAGEVGLAREATFLWRKLAARMNEEAELEMLQEATLLFHLRDADFACELAKQLVKKARLQGVPKQSVMELAGEYMQLARNHVEGVLWSRCGYRVAQALYREIATEYAGPLMKDDNAFFLARAIAESPGYLHSRQRRGVKAYQDYLRQWPQGKYVLEAHKAIMELANDLNNPNERLARTYADLGTASAKVVARGKINVSN